jgi:hypothetical protein
VNAKKICMILSYLPTTTKKLINVDYLKQPEEMSWEKLELLLSQGKDMKELIIQKQKDGQEKQEIQIMLQSTDGLPEYLEIKQEKILQKLKASKQVNVKMKETIPMKSWIQNWN